MNTSLKSIITPGMVNSSTTSTFILMPLPSLLPGESVVAQSIGLMSCRPPMLADQTYPFCYSRGWAFQHTLANAQ